MKLPETKEKDMKTELMPEHIKKLFEEAHNSIFNSVDYWKLRCIYREKMDDMTYSEYERNNCYNLWAILCKKHK
jgi:hypothetical protein